MAKSSKDWGDEIAAYENELAERELKAKEKLKQLKARQRDAGARESQQAKKLRDKKLILMGVVMEQMLDKHPQVQALFMETADATLTRPRDREIFGLTSAEMPAAKSAPKKKAAKKVSAESGDAKGPADN